MDLLFTEALTQNVNFINSLSFKTILRKKYLFNKLRSALEIWTLLQPLSDLVKWILKNIIILYHILILYFLFYIFSTILYFFFHCLLWTQIEATFKPWPYQLHVSIYF